MAKLFGIGSLDTQKSHPSDHTNASHRETDDHVIDVEIHEEHDHDGDIGQIAVDVLDLAEELIIVAPVA